MKFQLKTSNTEIGGRYQVIQLPAKVMKRADAVEYAGRYLREEAARGVHCGPATLEGFRDTDNEPLCWAEVYFDAADGSGRVARGHGF